MLIIRINQLTGLRLIADKLTNFSHIKLLAKITREIIPPAIYSIKKTAITMAGLGAMPQQTHFHLADA